MTCVGDVSDLCVAIRTVDIASVSLPNHFDKLQRSGRRSWSLGAWWSFYRCRISRVGGKCNLRYAAVHSCNTRDFEGASGVATSGRSVG